jgi:hypothetical protein
MLDRRLSARCEAVLKPICERYQVNTILALTDCTRENGATQVAPGSIEWPDERAVDQTQTGGGLRKHWQDAEPC